MEDIGTWFSPTNWSGWDVLQRQVFFRTTTYLLIGCQNVNLSQRAAPGWLPILNVYPSYRKDIYKSAL
jgi:hypothetical protein